MTEEQIKFEEFHKRQFSSHYEEFEKDEEGRYLNLDIFERFEVWQAARQSNQRNEAVADMKEALEFIKTHDCVDEEGFEYGIVRIKYEAGKPVVWFWSDLESALALKKRKGAV